MIHLASEAMDTFGVLPDPAEAGSLDDLVERLRLLKVWAGDPSYETIKDRVNAAWVAAGRPAAELTRRSTVANCFQTGRRRMNTDLVLAVVEALHPDVGYANQWRQALRVIAGETEAVSQIRVHDSLPPDLAGFTGRAGELDLLRRTSSTVVISGMAGVGKTRLAVHAAHRLRPLDQVLFVDLRGFHPDPAQPPADPAAVLDGFLRLLGVPGHQVPHGLTALTAAYRERLAGRNALVVLDNAATAEQVRPLLPETPGCLTLITSRRSLTDLPGVTRLTVGVFTPEEAVAFIARAVPGASDPAAAARIARRCGYLPLALSLITGHIRGTAGWTLADHADRLDERHDARRLDSGVELALDLSYQHLHANQQRLFRLAALHPAEEFDAYAAAALADVDLATAEAGLEQLRADHLVQGHYGFHDLVRAYATSRAHDRDSPPERRAALTRLFDHYLATSAAAMDAVFPAEVHRRPPRIPPATAAPDLSDPEVALAWLDNERPTLVAIAAHAPDHAVRLARTLFRYLTGGYHTDALIVHGHALQAARRDGDLAEQANALTALGSSHLRLGRPEVAAEHIRQAFDLFRRLDDPDGQAYALYNLGMVEERACRHPAATGYYEQALTLYRRAGDRTGEDKALSSLGVVSERAGRFPEAMEYFRQALELARETGHRDGQAFALYGMAEVGLHAGDYRPAIGHYEQSLALCRQGGDRISEAAVLAGYGLLHVRLGERDRAVEHLTAALATFREIGARDGEALVLNGLAEAATGAEAIAHHTAARAIAAEIGERDQLARADAGLGQACHALGDPAAAREHYQRAIALYDDLGVPEADEIRARVKELGRS